MGGRPRAVGCATTKTAHSTCCGARYLDGVEDQNRQVLVRSARGELDEREALVGVVRIPLEVHVDRHLDGTGLGCSQGTQGCSLQAQGCSVDGGTSGC